MTFDHNSATSPSRCALVTLAIGKLDYFARTSELMRRWAEREGWDFHVIRQRRLRHNPNWPRRRYAIHLEKYQLFDYFNQYDRILYLDADILVKPAAPSPFSLVPEEAIGAVWDDVGEDAWKREEELVKLEQQQGPLPLADREAPHFFNAGVLVMSRVHQPLWIFDRNAFIRGRWPDQSLLNYRVLREEVPVCDLGSSFNRMPVHGKNWQDAAWRRSAWLTHYASQPAKKQLWEDLPHFEQAWKDAAQPSALKRVPHGRPNALSAGKA